MSDILIIDFGGPIERKVSGLEGCHVATPEVGDVWEAWEAGMSDILKCDFGGPIEKKVSGLEGCRGFRGVFGLGSRCV